MKNFYHMNYTTPVADLEIFRGDFRLTKTPAKLEVKTKKKKKGLHQLFESPFPIAAVSLPSSTAPQHSNHTSG